MRRKGRLTCKEFSSKSWFCKFADRFFIASCINSSLTFNRPCDQTGRPNVFPFGVIARHSRSSFLVSDSQPLLQLQFKALPDRIRLRLHHGNDKFVYKHTPNYYSFAYGTHCQEKHSLHNIILDWANKWVFRFFKNLAKSILKLSGSKFQCLGTKQEHLQIVCLIKQYRKAGNKSQRVPETFPIGSGS